MFFTFTANEFVNFTKIQKILTKFNNFTKIRKLYQRYFKFYKYLAKFTNKGLLKKKNYILTNYDNKLMQRNLNCLLSHVHFLVSLSCNNIHQLYQSKGYQQIC